MRAHLGVIVVAVVVVFVVLGAYLGHQTLRTAERNTAGNAEHLAGLASEAVADSMALGSTQVAALAESPGAAQVLADPAACQLSFALDLFPGARLDVLATDGRVVCSSDPELAGGSIRHVGAWVDALATAGGRVDSGLVTDPASGGVAVVVASPIMTGSGPAVGAVAMVVPTAGIADQIASAFASPRGYRFSIVDEITRSTVSLSDGDPGEPNALDDREVIAEAEPVAGTTWVAFAGLDESTALASARSVLLRGALLGGAVLVVLLASFALLNRRIARPLRRLTKAVGESGPHADAALASVSGPTEVEALARAFRRTLDDHQDFEQALSHQALHDPLTGLPNRALLGERLTHSLEQALRSGRTVAVLFFDLDRFKLVNDSLGHAVGDRVLNAVAATVGDVLRPGDTLARFGGDEFVVVGDGFTDTAEVHALADRVLEAIAAPIEAGDTIVRVTASVGIALSDPTSRTADLIRDADTAMYVAKEHGGARHETFDRRLRDEVTERMTLETEFRVALDRGELDVVYQPQVELRTGETVAVEALLRWDHPALGSVPPSQFIPVAEETGLIIPVGRWVLREACRQAARWVDGGHDLTVAVNLSGRQLADPDLVDDVVAILDAAGLSPTRLCLELTESVLMYDSARAARTMAALSGIGVQLSVDDFGTGYSSLAYLHRFPVDELKIDRVFVNGITEGDGQGTLVSAVVAMAHALGLRIVAEGVETVAQAEALHRLGCHRAQGYLFARPGAPEDLTATLQDGPLAVTASLSR